MTTGSLHHCYAFTSSTPLISLTRPFTSISGLKQRSSFTLTRLARVHRHTSHSNSFSRRHDNKPTISCESSGPGSTSSASTTLSWGVGKSHGDTLVDAIPEAAKQACMSFRLRQVPVNLVLIFVSSTFESNVKDELRRVIPTAKKALAMLQVLSPETKFLGCTTGEDVTSQNSDYENKSAVNVTIAAAYIPSKLISVTQFGEPKDFSPDWGQQQWLDKLNYESSSTTSSSDGKNDDKVLFVLYTPDFAGPARDLLEGLDFALPGIRKLGCAAGKVNPLHEPYLFYDDVSTDVNSKPDNETTCQGALVITMTTHDMFAVDVAVAQGVRPLGPLLEVEEVRDQGNEIATVKELNTATQTRAPPMILLDMWVKTDVVSLEDGQLARKYLLMGTEVEEIYFPLNQQAKSSEAEQSQKQPTMISRKVTGFNTGTNSVGIEGDPVRLGMKVQFQIRDEAAASAELARLVDRLSLENSVRAVDGMSLMGAIVFVDAERGESLYGETQKDMDYRVFKDRFPVPIAVVTSQGQVGPLPSGGILSPGVGDSFILTASAVYVSIYGRTSSPVTVKGS